MKYMGSKRKIAKSIVPIIQKEIDEHNITTYIEPFCGGCSIIEKISCKNRIASDANNYLIELLKNAERVSTLPDQITREHYAEVKKCYEEKGIDFSDWYIGAIGFLASYNGRFFDGGYAGGIVHTSIGATRNYYEEAKRNLLNQAQKLKGIQFNGADYTRYTDRENCVFYLDPPYQNTQTYQNARQFDYDKFWRWAEYISRKNIVLISEKQAPAQFDCIWQQEVSRTLNQKKTVQVTEKLFRLHQN